MRELGLSMIDLLGTIITAYMMHRIFTCVLKPRFKMPYIIFWTCVANILYIYLKSAIFKNIVEIYTLYIIFMTLLLVIFYEGKWHERLLAFYFNGIAFVIAELICVQILFGAMEYNFDIVLAGVDVASVLIRWFALVIVGIVTYMVWRVQKNIRYVASVKSIMPVLLLYSAAFLMTLIYCGLIGVYQLQTFWWSWIYSALVVYVVMYIIQSISEVELRQQSLEKLEFIRRKDENVQIYYQNLTGRLKNVSKLKAQYEKKLNSIYEELGLEYEQEAHDGGNVQEDADVENASPIRSMAERILENKKKEMDEAGCSYELQMDFPEVMQVELMDLSSILNNLLDNAIEAVTCYQQPGKKIDMKKEAYIRGKSYMQGNELVIEVENIKSPNQRVVEINNKYISSKEKTGHGYGLLIIKRIAQKYDGRMEISYTENWFKNKVTLKIN